MPPRTRKEGFVDKNKKGDQTRNPRYCISDGLNVEFYEQYGADKMIQRGSMDLRKVTEMRSAEGGGVCLTVADGADSKITKSIIISFDCCRDQADSWKTLWASAIPNKMVHISVKAYRDAQLTSLMEAWLPDGWHIVESSSRPGQYSYENKYTGERIQWKPTRAASRQEGHSPDIKSPVVEGGPAGVPAPAPPAVQATGAPAQKAPMPSKVDLPDGWEAVASQSRPGEYSYENEYTGERIQWRPTRPADDEEGKSPDLAAPSY